MEEKLTLDEETISDLTDKIVTALKTVYDPEIPVDIYEPYLAKKPATALPTRKKALNQVAEPENGSIIYSTSHLC